MAKFSRIVVSAFELRRAFNEAGLWERAQRNELRQVLRGLRKPRVGSGEPDGTRSEVIEYHDAAGLRLATVHQYVRPDGSLGGSGRPDPKLMLIDDTEYIAEEGS